MCQGDTQKVFGGLSHFSGITIAYPVTFIDRRGQTRRRRRRLMLSGERSVERDPEDRHVTVALLERLPPRSHGERHEQGK